MKAKEILQMESSELKKRLEELRNEMLKLRSQSSSAPLKNSTQIKNTKKAIARILTRLNQKGGMKK